MDEVRFNAAVARALLRDREGGGIGMLGEKTLHSALKYYYEPNELSHEQRAEGYFADVKNAEGIIEVQTGSLGALKEKLAKYLPNSDVTVVYPVIRKTVIIRIDPDRGSVRRTHSSRVGRLEDAFLQLMYLGPVLKNPRLRVALPILDIEEQRMESAAKGRRKKRPVKLDRIPTALIDEAILTCAEDYLYFVPEGLLSRPGGFTVRQLVAASRYREATARALLYTLMNMDLIRRERRGREYVYTAVPAEDA